MYGVNPHLSNKEVSGKLEGGAYQNTADVATQTIKIQRVQNAIGCMIISILALYASNTQLNCAQTGFVFISLINSVAAFYFGVLLYNDQTENDTKTADGIWVAGFILINAIVMLSIHAGAVVSRLNYS